MSAPTMPSSQRPRRRILAKALLYVLIAASAFTLMWFGLLPPRLSPFAPLQLSEPNPWFLDFRLAALRGDARACSTTLNGPQVSADAIADNVLDNGCGWRNAVKLQRAGGAALPVGTVTCEMAAALAMWIEHDVQRLATQHLGSPVTRIDHMGGYACRNIIGSKLLKGFRSQHATANAVDISGFRLADGRSVRLARDWAGDAAEGRFLHAVHRAACRYFRVALGPDYNAAHHDHFHFDRGAFARCK